MPGNPSVPAATLQRLGTFAGENKVLAQWGERVFKLSEPAYHVLEGMLIGLRSEQIAAQINARGLLPSPATASTIDAIISQLQAMLFKGPGVSNRATDLRARLRVLGFAQMRSVLATLRGIFARPGVFYVTLAIAALSNILWMLLTPAPTLSGHVAWVAPLVLAGMIAISLTHELCHAAAAYAYGVMPPSVGIGLYLCFPVFYADVTGIWCLPARQRIIVNLAGVYVQLLLNLPLMWLASRSDATPAHWFVLVLAWMNAGAAFVNLIPFAKLDGYWVVADWIGSAHLQRDANALLANLVRWLTGRPWLGLRLTPGLLAYALGQLVFYALAFGLMGAAIVHAGISIASAPSAASALWRLVSDSPMQTALCAFLMLKLVTKLLTLPNRNIGVHDGHCREG